MKTNSTEVLGITVTTVGGVMLISALPLAWQMLIAMVILTTCGIVLGIRQWKTLRDERLQDEKDGYCE